MRWIEVEPTSGLYGSVAIPGSKNSVQALIAAACLADDPVTLQGVPRLKDLNVIYGLCQDIGIDIHVGEGRDVTLDPRSVHASTLDPSRTSSYRAAYYFVGALLAKFGRVSVGYPGGDNFGERPMEQHFKGLQALGAKISFHEDHYVVEAHELIAADIYFDLVTMGGTINLMLAAARAKGTTTLRNAARDPEVVDVANLLNQMGVRVRGAGTDVIRIEGTQHVSGCVHTVIPDRLIAGTYLMAAAATGGELTITGVIPEHLTACLAKLGEMGVSFTLTDQSVTAHADGPLKATRVRTSPYPGFATDLQQPLTATLLQAQGRSILVETVYNRFNHLPQLKRMGADLRQRQSGILIHGGKPLQGAWVHATDVRAGACLILAGLKAHGTTRITGVDHIERGYEDIVGTFQRLGASLRLMEGEAAGIESDSAAKTE